MTGRVVIVTGASSGLGYEVARYLCEGGNDVILACRNEEKANRAIEKIKRLHPNALATYMNLDLASLESVRKFVDDFRATGKKLHVLVNNAGMMCNFKDVKKQYTPENFEITMGTNHIGPYLLTNLLLEEMKKTGEESSDSRIINVTSNLHDPTTVKRRNNLQPLDLENILLLKDGTFNGFQAYKNSKLANVMFTYELARRLDETGVTANCVCPGFVPSTDLIRNSSGANKFVYRYIYHGMLRFTKLTKTIAQGAQAICALVNDEKYKGVTGKYFKDGAEAKSSEESLSEENQKKLWEMSGGYAKLDGYEPIDVPPPPVEEEKKEEEKKEEGEGSKEEEKKEEDGADNKTDDEKKTDDKDPEEKEPEDKEEKADEKEQEKEKEKEKEPEDKEIKVDAPAEKPAEEVKA